MQANHILGIDVGASGIKGAIVDIDKGELITERLKIPTPSPSTTEAVAEVFTELVNLHNYEGDVIGCGFPSIIKHGVCYSAANIENSWRGTDVARLFSEASGKQVFVTNDADAAGLSEMKYGKGKGVQDTVLLITIGSGLGSALFTNGHLVQNTEFGHLQLNNMVAEKYISNKTRKEENLEWDEFGKRFNEFLQLVERVTSPDLIILGGGISTRYELYSEYITIDTKVTTAQMFNHAGIIGAALFAHYSIIDEW